MEAKQGSKRTHILGRADVGTDQVIETKQSRRGTHVLERVDIRTGHNMKTMQGGKGTDFLGGQMSGLVRIKTKQRNKGNSQAREGRCQDWPGHGNKAR